jgi:hypothetical protein
LIESRLLVPLPGPHPTFDATNLRTVTMAYPLSEATGLDLEVATYISDAI